MLLLAAAPALYALTPRVGGRDEPREIRLPGVAFASERAEIAVPRIAPS